MSGSELTVKGPRRATAGWISYGPMGRCAPYAAEGSDSPWSTP
jgi:hypothetical protein